VLTKQLGHRPSEASQLITDALRRRPTVTTPEQLFDEIYRSQAAAKAEDVSVTEEDSRILSRAAAPTTPPFERALRPRSFEEYVGQDQAVASLRVSVEAAKQRGECGRSRAPLWPARPRQDDAGRHHRQRDGHQTS